MSSDTRLLKLSQSQIATLKYYTNTQEYILFYIVKYNLNIFELPI